MKIRHLSLLALAATAMACSAGTDDDATQEDDLTSITARTRTLKFASYVYVRDGASQSEIIDAVQHQTQSAFGALRTADIGVQSRELAQVDAKTFVKTQVKVVDATKTGDTGRTMTKVAYTYTDTALVPKTMATRSSLSMGVLAGDYESQTARILKECTSNDSHAREFESSIWYVFEPGLSQCKTAMTAEQQKIDADKKKLGSTVVPLSEVNRLYIPVTASLASAGTTTGTTYPEYDRLFSGGVAPGKLVIGMVNGLMADWAAGEVHANVDDAGYPMWFEGLREIFKARPGFKMVKIEPQEDLTTFIAGTKTIKMPGGFDDILKMELDGVFPATATDHQALRVAVANKLIKHWVTFDAPVTVKIGSAAAKDLTIELQTYFGAESSAPPYKRAIKTSDIFVYNGHSYIGYGPLDPSNFSASDFPSSYQILVVNGCISFNYYDHYFGLKSGGTKNLDTITNGLESWVDGSGPAMGRLVGALIDGKKNSYNTILKASQFDYYAYGWGNDALRVVDGETDNVFKPSKVSLSVTAR